VHTVNAHIIGLSHGVKYKYRLVGTNAGGTTNGATATFVACGSCRDFNGDGHPDVFYGNKTTGATSVWFMGGTNGIVRQGNAPITAINNKYPSTAYVPEAIADFNRDGKPDILYWNRNTGVLFVWFLGGANGVVEQSSVMVSAINNKFPSTAYIPVGVEDYNGDGNQDVLYWNSQTGVLFVWAMGGAGGTHELSSTQVTAINNKFPSLSYVPAATADFTGDGQPDVLYWNKGNGVLFVWALGGTGGTHELSSTQVTAINNTFPSTAYVPSGASDYDGDGAPDILYWNKNNGVLFSWFMGGPNGAVESSSAMFDPHGASFPPTAWLPTG
jgi:hypothetical protein